jgi:epoxyqueuosine reductase
MGVADPSGIPQARERLEAWLAAGHHGDMAWMAERREQRASPAGLWPAVRSVVMLGMSYAPARDPLANLARPERGTVSVYARSRDYHDVVKGRLKQVASLLAARSGAGYKVFVDTAPVMEKPLAAAAGLGWQGKHSVLVSRSEGSWLFLGAIYTTAELPFDTPGSDHCGSCRRCLDICPTDAFPAPYRLDATRCIAYLTIEHDGPIPRGLRAGIGNRIFGCDDCLAVCPWNRFAKAAREQKLSAREELDGIPLADLAALDEAGFRALFSATPVKRTGRDRFVRNVLVAIGNSGRPELAEAARARLDDASPLVRGAAVWAFSRLAEAPDFAERRAAALEGEADPQVRSEWLDAGDDPPGPRQAPEGAPA